MIQEFNQATNGNVAVLTAFSLIPMLVLAGGATDVARHESYRVQLQDGVDRAVLAAASLSQTQPIEATVGEYLKSLPFITDVDVQVDADSSTNNREVTVTATYNMETSFLRLISIESIDVTARATAVEKRQNIEISLVLDISGSMRNGSPSRIRLLKPAAKQFIETILNEESAAYTSVSIVPYAGSVNPGAMAFGGLGIPRRHNHSSCVEFTAGDYATGVIPFNQRTQVAHFTNSHQGVSYPGLGWPWCPLEDTSISYITNDANYLKSRIDSLIMYDGTGTAIAVKWGMLLLEPAAQPLMAYAASHGMVPAEFSSRPARFDDPNTIKFIVLMTDGDITEQRRPNVYDYPRAKEQDNYTSQNRNSARDSMYAVCNRAKANGVIVFTIGFQVSSQGRAEMQNCASSISHFYDVNGIDIDAAFRSIATAIQKVRLTE
nr:pilus assembly protein TadG-related protein [Devosia sp. 1635]